MSKGLVSLLFLVLSGCSIRTLPPPTPMEPEKDLQVGDCYISAPNGSHSEAKLFKVIAVGRFSYEVIDTYGDKFTTSSKGHADEQVDCFDRFGKK